MEKYEARIKELKDSFVEPQNEEEKGDSLIPNVDDEVTVSPLQLNQERKIKLERLENLNALLTERFKTLTRSVQNKDVSHQF